ncbi:MAG TPA: C1 family peptidase [Herpetosiphonaceae bacterium]
MVVQDVAAQKDLRIEPTPLPSPAFTPVFNAKIEVPETGAVVGTGWLPPVPDMRDYTTEQPEIAKIQQALKIAPMMRGNLATLPTIVDLRQWCSPIENQGRLGSCTAHAAVGIVEYFERRAFGKHLDGSRLFVYKTTRNLMGVAGDTGSWLRYTMGALRLCGVPPEKYWPYTDRTQPGPSHERTFDEEPSSFVYALAENYECLRYFAHDPLGQNLQPAAVLESVKRYLAAGIPSMFGFFGFPSFGAADVTGGFPYPGPSERAIWGHAVAAVGYDDTLVITNTQHNIKTKGALLLRNSWGTTWGDHGYGWLPYDYVLNRLAIDFWSMLAMEYVNTGEFGLD